MTPCRPPLSGDASAEQFAHALVRSGVRGRTSATVLSDGDDGLRNLQRRVLPRATASGAQRLPLAFTPLVMFIDPTNASHSIDQSREERSVARSHQIPRDGAVPHAVANLNFAVPCAQVRVEGKRVLTAAHP
jgi:hypothetical protein